jgi:D-methionine transport system permease protein
METMFLDYFKVPVSTVVEASCQTVYMVALSLIVGAILGMLLALFIVLTKPGGQWENKTVHSVISTCVNIVRSIPFIILIVAIMPLTKLLVGTRVGTTAALVPLVVHITPYLSRLFENSLLEVDDGVIEAAKSMGATTGQIIWHFLLPEATPSLILALTTGTIGLLGSTASAGAVGAGGVGNLALMYGYQRMNTPLMLLTVLILIVIVQLIQTAGNEIAYKLRHK